MKKLAFVLVLAILLAGGAVVSLSAPCHAQVYEYPPPPTDIYAAPWVGPNTPWVYYNGDWFLNGILYYFFGPQYGWAPYYAYPPVLIVRPYDWYTPRWHAWYVAHPQIVIQFNQAYPFWRGHTHTHRYDQRFYEKHHRGAGAGWQEGFRGIKPDRSPERGKPAPPRAAPPERGKPAPPRAAPPERKPAPPRVTPPEERRGPARVAPPEKGGPGPARVAPPEGRKPGPAKVSPPEGRKPDSSGRERAPAPKPEKAGKPEKEGRGKPEKEGRGGDKQ